MMASSGHWNLRSELQNENARFGGAEDLLLAESAEGNRVEVGTAKSNAARWQKTSGDGMR